jgi:hypothetical protein
MTAGSCFPSCVPPDLSCESPDDCFGEQYCCVAPGLVTGQCVSNEMACGFVFCENDGDCADPEQVCCDEAPLTESICVDECPPQD